MAISNDNHRLIITITKQEHELIKRTVAARLKEGYKATESSVGAELIRAGIAGQRVSSV